MTTAFVVDTNGGISGSLTTLIDGSSYLIAGENISVLSQSNGSVVISSPIVTGSIGSIVGAVKTATTTSTEDLSKIDPDLVFTVMSGSTWAVQYNLYMNYTSTGTTLSVESTGDTVINSNYCLIEPGNCTIGQSSNLGGGPLTGIVIISACVTDVIETCQVQLSYECYDGTASCAVGSTMFATRVS